MKTPWPRLVALLLYAVVPGCAQPTKPAAAPDYFADADRCGRQSQLTTKLRVNTGVLGGPYGNVGTGPAEMTIPLGPDQEAYRLCMERSGWKTEVVEDPGFALAQSCQQAARKTGEAESADRGRIGGFDTALYEECMKNKGAVGTVTVLPVRPAPPE